MSDIVEIKEAVAPDILQIKGVTGIGVGKSSSEKINVYVKRACPNVLANIPAEIGGVEVRIIETGGIFALPLLQQQVEVDRAARWRPYMGGVSVGHIATTAGTLAAKVYDAETGKILLLSNAHIFANGDTKQTPMASRDDSIFQPGPFDGGSLASDKIAELEGWVKLDEDSNYPLYTGKNTIDAAVAKPLVDSDVSDEIVGIGTVSEMGIAKVGQKVRMSGRSSGVTGGFVIDTNATIKISYSNFSRPYTATFQDQIIITPAIAQAGDSGSLLIDDNNRAVGLVFAGSEFITSANKIINVAKKLNIHFGNPQVPEEEPPGEEGFWGLVPALLIAFGMMKIGKTVSDRKLSPKPVSTPELKLKYYRGGK